MDSGWVGAEWEKVGSKGQGEVCVDQGGRVVSGWVLLGSL